MYILLERSMPAARDAASTNRESPEHSSDGGTSADCGALFGFWAPSSPPETILLQGDRALLVHEIHAIIGQFVMAGNSVELRKLGGQVALKLCREFEGEDFEWLISRLTDRALCELPRLGCTCNELFHLLQSLASSGVSISTSPLLSISRKVVDSFTSQLRLMGHGKPGLKDFFSPEEGTDSKVVGAERYNFTSCVYCHCNQDTSLSGGTASTSQGRSESSSNRVTRASRLSTTQSGQVQDIPMLPEQVRPFARESLDSSVDVSLSTEFSMYVQLKCRLALSDIHVTIGDPRGRYVKTIAVYFSPRPVTDPNVLKSEEYADAWQRCATISLSRGATRASCSLTPPVIAANLRIEYLDFYERPGGSRAADGSLLLHCPRCTRVVNNAHGVCGHCGEVAFQCRKCRHINYDRLDAFLCVECGYCSAGTFSFDLTCGAASNAVAIMDDDSYERSIKVLRVATKLHEELRSSLNDRVQPSGRKRSLSVHKYGPAVKRTFVGELPKIIKEKTDLVEGASGSRLRSSGVSSSDRGRDESDPSAAGNRARSLLRLARQLRNESSSDRSSGDLLVRQALLGSAGRGTSIDEIDELDGDVVGFISSDLDGPDPLSRLVEAFKGARAPPQEMLRVASTTADLRDRVEMRMTAHEEVRERMRKPPQKQNLTSAIAFIS